MRVNETTAQGMRSFLSAPAAYPLPKKADQQGRLNRKNGQSRHDQRAMFLPKRGWTKSNGSVCGQMRRVDVPAIENAPVIHRGFRADGLNCGRRRARTTQRAYRCASQQQALVCLRLSRPPDNAVTQLAGEVPKNRRLGYFCHARQTAQLITRHTRCVFDQRKIEDCRVRGKMGKTLEHLFKGQIVEAIESHPTLKWLKRLFALINPTALQGRVSRDHFYPLRLRQKLQNVLDYLSGHVVRSNHKVAAAEGDCRGVFEVQATDDDRRAGK